MLPRATMLFAPGPCLLYLKLLLYSPLSVAITGVRRLLCYPGRHFLCYRRLPFSLPSAAVFFATPGRCLLCLSRLPLSLFRPTAFPTALAIHFLAAWGCRSYCYMLCTSYRSLCRSSLGCTPMPPSFYLGSLPALQPVDGFLAHGRCLLRCSQ